MITERFKNILVEKLLLLFLIICAFLFLLPIIWWIIFAMRDTASIAVGETLKEVWIPEQYQFLKNLKEAFDLYPMGRFFANSFIISFTVTIFELLIASMSGYAFAKYNFTAKNIIFKVILALLMIPQIVLVIPLFQMVVGLKLANTYLALIVPFMVTPFGIFMMRQFMYAIPDEYIEAARIEGAGEFKIFFRIVLPLSKNSFATLGIFTFLMQWDSLLWPLIATSKQKMYTLAVGISLLQTNVQVPYNALYAITLLFSIPVLVVFLLLQRLVIRSLAMTGLKG
jgi:multiple sugar transport system permease protein